MAMLHAYFDESGKQGDHPLIAFCGVCAPYTKIEKFEGEWNGLLRRYGLQDFHMVKASRYSRKWGNIPKQSVAERIEVLEPFADCMADSLELGLIQAWDVKGFKAISPEALQKIGNPNNPYYIAFSRALLAVADYAQEQDAISIVCDHDEETAWNCYRHYRAVRKASDKVKKKTAAISFADDRHFAALQAADMAAFLTRLEAREQFYGISYEFRSLFDYMTKDRGASKMKWFKMFADEKLASGLLKSAIRKK
jgi:hypothetical protein